MAFLHSHDNTHPENFSSTSLSCLREVVVLPDSPKFVGRTVVELTERFHSLERKDEGKEIQHLTIWEEMVKQAAGAPAPSLYVSISVCQLS